FAECGWLGATGEYDIPRLASAGNLLRARRRVGFRSLGRGHAGPWDTRQFSRRGSHRDSDVGGGEEGEARIPARSRAGESPPFRVQGCRSRAALTWPAFRDEAVRAEARGVRVALYPTVHAETRWPRAVAWSIQPVGQRS